MFCGLFSARFTDVYLSVCFANVVVRQTVRKCTAVPPSNNWTSCSICQNTSQPVWEQINANRNAAHHHIINFPPLAPPRHSTVDSERTINSNYSTCTPRHSTVHSGRSINSNYSTCTKLLKPHHG